MSYLKNENIDLETAAEENVFLNYYQSLKFKKESVDDPFESANISRKILASCYHQMSKYVCNETQLRWTDIHLRKYNAEVDKRGSKNCIDNDCNAISKLVQSKMPQNKTSAGKWKSSLSNDKASLLKLLQPVKNCSNVSKENEEADVRNLMEILLSNINNAKQHESNNVQQNSLLSTDHSVLQIKEKEKACNFTSVKTNMNGSYFNKIGSNTNFVSENDSLKVLPSERFHNSSNFAKQSLSKKNTCFESNNVPKSSYAGGRKFHSNSNYSKNVNEQNYDEKPNCNGGSNVTKKTSLDCFKTARTELKIQNMNKYGNSNGPQNYGDSGYGCQKKSLGGLGGRSRSVTSKFKPPVHMEENWEAEDSGYREESSGDEKDLLRCIDKKMVELIENEIMDQGTPITWDDIAGLEFAKKTIQEIVVLPFLRPDLFTGLRSPPKGILLFGPPGTGKTLIGKCIASESESTFFSISASSLTSKWIGDGEKMVRALFAVARSRQPAVIFIDEIDSLLSQRSDTEHESSRRMKTEFLVQLDGATTGDDDRILIIGATNRPQELDEAARRRLIKRLYIPLPDHPARVQIVTRLMSSEKNDLTTDQIENISMLTDGYSGADMKCVCKEASLEPIRSIDISRIKHISTTDVRPITIDDFMAAISRVKSSVSSKDLDQYLEWDKQFGSGGTSK